MVKSSFLSLFFLFCALSIEAQVNRYAVFFTDKQNSSYSLTDPNAFLSTRALSRRAKNDVVVTEQDIPVNSAYVQLVAQSGAIVLFRSRWLNAVIVQCQADILATIQSLPYVDKVEYLAPGSLQVSSSSKPVYNQRAGGSNSVKTNTQLASLGLDAMHELDMKGAGVKVAVFDSGFPGVNTLTAFSQLQSTIGDTYNFVNKQSNVYVNDDHGTEVVSVMAGFSPETFIGGAYQAEYHLYVTEDVPTEYRIEEYNWLLAAERADSAGVDVINASLGYSTFDDSSMDYTKQQLDGKTALVTKAAQWAAERGIVVVVSAGNEGANTTSTITPPADALDVIAVGSVTSTGIRSPFSSIGPTSDNRIKPDLCAMGTGVMVIRQGGNTGVSSGTSFSSPLLACLVAGIIQRYDTLTRSEIIDLLKSTASLSNAPSAQLGYGIPSFTAVRDRIEVITDSEKFSIKELIEFFPNPTDSNFINLQVSENVFNKQLRIELFTVQGEGIREVFFTPNSLENTTSFDLSHVSAGVYLVRITIGKNSDILKIVKAR